MSWSVTWDVIANADVLRMNWRVAGRACAALAAFAERGEGTPEADTVKGHYKLRAPGAVVFFRVDHAMRTIFVQRVFATK